MCCILTGFNTKYDHNMSMETWEISLVEYEFRHVEDENQDTEELPEVEEVEKDIEVAPESSVETEVSEEMSGRSNIREKAESKKQELREKFDKETKEKLDKETKEKLDEEAKKLKEKLIESPLDVKINSGDTKIDNAVMELLSGSLSGG